MSRENPSGAVYPTVPMFAWAAAGVGLQPTTRLVTTGPFRISRSPIYVGLTAILVGLSLDWGNPYSLVHETVLSNAIGAEVQPMSTHTGR